MQAGAFRSIRNLEKGVQSTTQQLTPIALESHAMSASAQNYLRAAKHAGRLTLTKWSADPAQSAENYSRAGKAFKAAGMVNEAESAFDSARKAYLETGALSHAARMMEELALLARDTGRLDEVHDLAAKGAHLYRQHGYPASALCLLKKGAKIIENHDPEKVQARSN